ncbi:MAG: Sulfotransferase [Pedosphaera sp.]|nr:Sulfotransferase [Pedosphaera sp.]
MPDLLSRAATPEPSGRTNFTEHVLGRPQKRLPPQASLKKQNLDFIIIGAPKCGTTSLHRYLQPHPELYLLPEKEVPFFTNPEYCAKGWDWYLDEFFAQASPKKLWGKATPQYMSRLETPEKIYAQLPQVKLIALLRNPIDCTYSWYKMMVKRNQEKRTLAEAIDKKLHLGVLEQRQGPDVALGEYSRMLTEYRKFFPRDQLLVLFTEDLKKDPRAVLKRVLRFLEVDENFVPRNLGTHYHVGGSRRRIALDEHALAKHPLFRKIIDHIPVRYRNVVERRFLFWFMIWNTRPDSPDQQMPAEARERLRQFFSEDVRRLEQLLNERVPWREFATV